MQRDVRETPIKKMDTDTPWIGFSVTAVEEKIMDPLPKDHHEQIIHHKPQMDVLRRQKDRSYRNVFKGSVLVSTLMDHDGNKFASRASAVKFAQRLLDAGHIESIVGSCAFEDSVHLYRWADETVVREAKKMVSISSHIPKKKLIELVDMNGSDSVDAYDMKDVKDKLIAKSQAERPTQGTFTTKEEARRASRRERALRRRTLGAVQIGDAMDKLNEANSTLNNNLINSTNLNRVSSLSQENLDTSSYGSCDERTTPPKTARKPRVRSPDTGEHKDEPEIKSNTAQPRRRGVTSPPLLIDTKQNTDTNTKSDIELIPSAPTSPTTCLDSAGAEHKRGKNATDDEMEEAQKATLESSNGVSEMNGVVDENDISTCVYDGVEMKALDIENLDFDKIRPKPNENLIKINKGLDTLSQQSYSFSDNEKHLLDQMKKMKVEHEAVVKAYEDRIKELLVSVTDLRLLSEKLEGKNGLTQTQPSPEKITDINGVLDDSSVSSESDATSLSSGGAVIPVAPAPPAPPPPPPLGLTVVSKVVKPTKPHIKPRLKMRPLFWNRIILDEKNKKKSDSQEGTCWHRAQEPKFDVDAFERLFGKADDDKSSKAKSLHDAMSSRKGKGKFQTAKILEQNRSRAVAIKLRSMHCQMSDIKAAVYSIDHSQIDLDSLYSLYLIRGTKAEIDKISTHLQCHDDPLDQPEQFLWELSQMSHFPERIECMMLQKRFNETLFNIDQQLSTVQTACAEIKQNQPLQTIMETILAFGNYMNGNTPRGQADGYEFTILSKIKDVRSMDNSTNLLQYIVRTYMKDYEEDAGKDEAVFRLPDPSLMSQAGQVSFTDLDQELNNLQHQLQTHAKKAELVCLDTETKLLQPFKDKMDDFFETAEAMVRDQQEKLTDTRSYFKKLLAYLAVKDTTEQNTPDTVFSIWATFCDNFKMYWKLEQKRIARMMFEKVEARKRARMRAARRRKSVNEDGKSNMKQRFAQMRRRSENVNPTVKMLRSQSLVDTHAESDSEITNGSRSAPTGEDGRRRRRRPQSEVYETEQLNYQSDASVTSTRSETMAERMQRRRRSRINSEEVQNNIQNARQENGRVQRPVSMDETNSPKSRLYSNDNQDYASDNERLTRRQMRHKSVDDSSEGFNQSKNATPEKTGPRRRRAAVVSKEEGMSDATTEENTRPARQRYRKSDSMTSLTDIARNKPPGDRSPISPSSQQYNNMAYNPLSRYGGQQYNENGYEQKSRRTRTVSPVGTDPGAPPRPALPASYSYRNTADTDIMDTDQEKINYREAIRKVSGGPRKRSTDLSPKSTDHRTSDLSPISRLR